jgi:hypothetical protein
MHIDHDALLSSLIDQCLIVTFLSGLLSPHHVDSVLLALSSFSLSAPSSHQTSQLVHLSTLPPFECAFEPSTPWVVCFLTLPPFECTLEPSTTLDSVLSSPISLFSAP